MTAEALFAIPAVHGKATDGVVARFKVSDLIADIFDNSRGLVAEDSWSLAVGPFSLDVVKVAVAKSSCSGANENLPGSYVCDANLPNLWLAWYPV